MSEEITTSSGEVTISMDKITVSESGDMDVTIDSCDVQPLSANMTHAVLRIDGDDASVRVDLDGEAIDALADAMYHIQEGEL